MQTPFEHFDPGRRHAKKCYQFKGSLKLASGFNDATCGIYSDAFLPFTEGAQKNICMLSNKAIRKTDNYMSSAKAKFDIE